MPRGGEWLYEPKWDGFRAIATVSWRRCRARSRNDNDLTERFAAVARALPDAVATPDAVLDGEVCALDDAGNARFGSLQRGEGRLVFVAFDLLELDGRPLVDEPLERRREQLAAVIRPERDDPGVTELRRRRALLAACREQGLEGVMAKRPRSRYREGARSPDWVKVKLSTRQEFVVVGWTPGEGSRSRGIGALVLAVKDGGELRHVGSVGSGLSGAELARLGGTLRALARPSSPLAVVPRLAKTRPADVHWVEPRVVVEVEFAEWTSDGKLRAPVYVGTP